MSSGEAGRRLEECSHFLSYMTLGHFVRTLCLSVPFMDIYWSLLLVRPRARQGFIETKEEGMFSVLMRFFVGKFGPL